MQQTSPPSVFGIRGAVRDHETSRVGGQNVHWSRGPKTHPRSRIYAASRRLLDIASAVVALLAFGLILPFIALAIILDSRGPIFYAQTRIGINRRHREFGVDTSGDRRKVIYPGRPFVIYKLRTMTTDAEKQGPMLADQNDRRITTVGRILRKTRLDEVPQFWNVLKGEMSIIGPRPERLHFIHQYDAVVPGYTRRLAVLPGITGLAQVRNGYDDDLESVRRKVALDRCYLCRAGFLTDLGILISTVRVVLTGEGAR